jgi:DNA-binding protein HU-alpha
MAVKKSSRSSKEPKPETVAIKTATPQENDAQQTPFKKSDFLTAMVERSGLKQRDARAAAEAALSILSERLTAGDTLQIPPLGRIKIVKSKSLDDGAILTAKIRIKSQSAPDSDTLEVAGEAG